MKHLNIVFPKKSTLYLSTNEHRLQLDVF